MYKFSCLIFFAAALQACSTTTATPPASAPQVGVAVVAGGTAYTGTVSVVTNGTAITLPKQNHANTWGVTAAPVYVDANTLAGGYQTTYGLAVAGRQNGVYFAGQSGLGYKPPTTGTGSLGGLYYVVDDSGAVNGSVSFSANFGAGTITGTGGTGANALAANGAILGASVTGTVTYKGSTGNWAGTFHNPGTTTLNLELLSAFAGPDFAGVMIGLN